MHRYFLELNYDGSPFKGWQIQDNGPSVQQCINEALSILLGNKTKCIGCGRTDAGVHALQFYAHFDSEKIIDDFKSFKHQLNGILPPEIAIVDLIHSEEKSHTRFDAVKRTYHYVLSKRKNAFLRKYSHTVFNALNLDAMNAACTKLLAHDDFATFCKKGSDVNNTLCKLYEARWTEYDQFYVFEISANRFLRGMVRALTGNLLKVGEGAMSVEEFDAITNSKDRQNSAAALPAQGLFLSGVTYPYIATHEPFKFFLG